MLREGVGAAILLFSFATPAAAIDWPDLLGGEEPSGAAFRDEPAPASWDEIEELGFREATIEKVNQALSGVPQVLTKPETDPPIRIGLVWDVARGRGPSARGAALAITGGEKHRWFLLERNFGTAPDRLACVLSSDPWMPLRLLGTSGDGDDRTNERIVALVEHWNRQAPLELTGAGPGWLEVRFDDVPGDVEGIVADAREVASEAIPDVERTRDVLARTKTLLLWW